MPTGTVGEPAGAAREGSEAAREHSQATDEHSQATREQSQATDEHSQATREHSQAACEQSQARPVVLSHRALKALLGAWALAACAPWEAEAVEHHLSDCPTCAEEALLLREAIGLLHPTESLDLDSGLRTRVLDASFARRAPRVPVPAWAAPYDAETARLDALLQDIDAADWRAPVQLRWYENDLPVQRRSTVAAVVGHLLTVDGLVAVTLGLADPLGVDTPSGLDAVKRTESYWRASSAPPTDAVRSLWRDQSRCLVRAVASSASSASSAAATNSATDGVARGVRGNDIAGLTVPYGDFVLPLHDALVDRAFECWIHATDIAAAVAYPYDLPVPRHMHAIIDLTVRRLPGALALRRRGGPPEDGHRPTENGAGRVLRLEVEGASGGEWLIDLDSPALVPRPKPAATRRRGARTTSGRTARAEVPVPSGRQVAHVALDDFEFCRLAAGHISPEEATAGSTGDRTAIADVLTAVASLSRM